MIGRRAFVAVGVAAVFALATEVTLGGTMYLDPSTLGVFRQHVVIPIPTLAAEVDLKPESLEKTADGVPVDAFIAIAGGRASEIVAQSVRLCRGFDPCTGGVAAVSARMVDGGMLMATFPRAEVAALVADVPPPQSVRFTVTGAVRAPAAQFSGGDDVLILAPRGNAQSTPSESSSEEPLPPLSELVALPKLPTLAEDELALPTDATAPPVEATVDDQPAPPDATTVEVVVELPTGAAIDVDPSSAELCEGVTGCGDGLDATGSWLGDANGNGSVDLILSFALDDRPAPGGAVTVSGRLRDGRRFIGGTLAPLH